MDLTQNQDAESPGPSPIIIGQKPRKRDHCESCLSRKSDNLDGHTFVRPMEMVASGEYCRACAGILEFLNAQASLPIVKLGYFFGPGPPATPFLNVIRYDENLRYEFFTTSEGSNGNECNISDKPVPFPDFPSIWRMRKPSGDTSSTKAFDTLKGWISRCQEEHRLCQPAEDTELPHRVLEIESIQPLCVRVVEDCPRRESYACLSHRWGPQTESNSLKTHNLDMFKTEVPAENFYPLMKDAIEAAFRLDLRFIWIDCYCIIQDDIKDWEMAAAHMASIYENAFMTISATSSEGGSPMFSTLDQAYAGTQVTEIRGEPVFVRQELEHPCLFYSHVEREYLEGPLLKRGWVFQERLLSKTFVHFMRDEIFWECRESTWCECMSKGLEWLERRKKAPRTLNESWEDIVHQFRETELTFMKDRLRALAGIARRYGKRHGKTYLAGLWKEDLPGALAWETTAGDIPRPLQHVAPTWSWASLLPSRFFLLESWPSKSIRFLGCSIQPHDADVYAGAHHLEITLEGPVLDLKVYKQDYHLVGRSGNAFLWILPDFKVDPHDLTKYRAVPDGSSCQLLMMVKDEPLGSQDINGIVLLKNDNTESDVVKFERIGAFSNHRFGRSWYLDDSNEFAEYCGGRFPPFLGKSPNQVMDKHAEWLLERAEMRKVTLI